MNMKNICMTLGVLVLAHAAVGAPGPSIERIKAGATNEAGKAKLAFYQREGGVVFKNEPDNRVVLVANTQTNVNRVLLLRTTGYLKGVAKMNVDCRDVGAKYAAMPTAAAVKELKAAVAVFVVYDPSSTAPFLVSPDEHWARVNVAALDADRPGQEALVNRTRMAVLRAVAHVCGGAASQGAGGLVGPFTGGIGDYDRFAREDLPITSLQLMQAYLKPLGSRPAVRATYRAACQEGWAPAPENEFQKAIWDQVHAIPNKPMKIKFDPAAQKGTVTK